jgi:hypothetical protein
MAKTKVTKRVKTYPEEIAQSEVASLADPGSPLSTAAVTDCATPVSVAKLEDDLADTDNEFDYKMGISSNRIPHKCKLGYFDDDPMETDVKQESVDIKLEEKDDDDEIPIGEEFETQDTEVADEGDEPPEDFPLGNSKKPGTGTTAVKKGSGHSGSPVAWMVPNVNIKNFAHAHVGAVSYGFAPNGDPVPGFHNYVLKTMVKDEDNPFFITKNVGEDSLVDLVNRDGDVIVNPAVTTRGNSIEKKIHCGNLFHAVRAVPPAA